MPSAAVPRASSVMLAVAFPLALLATFAGATALDTDGVWSAPTPTQDLGYVPYGHVAAADPSTDILYLYGGDDLAHSDWLTTLTLGGEPYWISGPQTPPTPGGLADHAAIFDPVRQRILVLCGDFIGRPYLNDVWSYDPRGYPPWSLLAPLGPPPSPRYGLSAVYDWRRDRVLVFGGSDANGYLNDVWALDLATGPEWTPLLPSGTPPPPRRFHTAIYDPWRDRMIVFGGEQPPNGATAYADVWELSLGGTPAWTEITPAGPTPSARAFAAGIYDPMRDRLVIFGGGILGGATANDTWALALAGAPAWTPLAPTGGPPSPRTGHTATYDPARDRMIVVGGRSTAPEENLWALRWGEPTAPVVSCPEAIVWSQPGSIPVTHRLTNPSAAPQRYQVSLGDAPGWLTPELDTAIVVGAGETVDFHSTVVIPDAAPPGVVEEWFYVNRYDSRSSHDSCFTAIADITTPTRVAWVSVGCEGTLVRLQWQIGAETVTRATVERRESSTTWSVIGQARSSADGTLAFEDRAAAGRRYAYRLALDGPSGRVTTEERWVTVPSSPAGLTLRTTGPQPARSRLGVMFASADPGPVTLVVLDAAGRRVRTLAIPAGSEGSKERSVAIDVAGLPPGVYLIQARQGNAATSARAVIAR